MKLLSVILVLVFSFSSYARRKDVSPLPSTADTIGLWNFDTDSGDTVPDLSSNPLVGTAYNTTRLAMPGADTSFNEARHFVANSFVDLGQVVGSKLDLTNAIEFRLDALINLDANDNGTHTIFTTENIRLMVVNNHLAGFIRQNGGLFGVIGDTNLVANNVYRVTLILSNQKITVLVNNRVDGQVEINGPIMAPQFSNSRAFIGGDLFNKYFPGYIDDVRIKTINDFDVDAPTLSLIEPTTYSVDVAHPNFKINFSDASAIDLASVRVYLNGVQQTVSFTQTGINGTLSDGLATGIVNEVKVVVSDINGNKTEKSFFFSFLSLAGRTEYEVDGDTLGLWHMNDYAASDLIDSTNNHINGYADPVYLSVAEGVFGNGRTFSAQSQYTLRSIQIPGQAFTWEAWVRPTSPNLSDEILFSNGQIRISRYYAGYVRVTMVTTRQTKIMDSRDTFLKTGELHHVAVTWDGTKTSKNLKIFIDGFLVDEINAPFQCDFTPAPQAVVVGQSFYGMMDEMRLSSIARSSFNIPIFDNQGINFLSPVNGDSFNTDHPAIHVELSGNNINSANVKVFLNKVRQLPSANLTITNTNIDGVMTDGLQLGLNQLDVEFLDGTGSQKKRTVSFFYAKDKGSFEYSVDPQTVALWHMNQFDSVQDETTSHNDLAIQSSTSESGVIGKSRKGTMATNDYVINLGSRPFTVEGFYKFSTNATSNSFYQLYNFYGSDLSHQLLVNPVSGDIRVYISNPDQYLDQTIGHAFPTDNQFHHVAMVHDPSRGFSSLLLMVDGAVKHAFNYKVTCDCMNKMRFDVGATEVFADELRISKVARYDFNIGDFLNVARPSLTATTVTPYSTVKTASLNVSFDIADQAGLDEQGTYLAINGVKQNLTLASSGASATLSGTASGLIPGSNEFVIKMKNQFGAEQTQTYYIFYFAQGAATQYVADSDTTALYHFNETSGTTLADDSGNGYHMTVDGSWNLNPEGVFGTTGATTYSSFPQVNAADPNGLGTYTVEAWVKYLTTNKYLDLIRYGGMSASIYWGERFYVVIPGIGGLFSPEGVVKNDGQYHHVAFVVDKNHPKTNIYFVVDGNVVAYKKVANPNSLNLNSTPALSIGGTLYSNGLDELRFSKAARYTLNSSLSKKKENKQIAKR